MKKPFPFATALRRSLPGYNLACLRDDLMAAFVVSLVALPLSMALAIAVGLPPQHGLYTAIVAGIVTPLAGGAVTQVSGPTAAFVVILAPIVTELGLHGLLWCGLIAGVLLILMGLARLGRLIEHVPYTVTTGFTAGIAVVLATLSLNDFLGLNAGNLEGHFFNKVAVLAAHLSALDPATALTGAVTLLLLVFAGRFIRVIPPAIIAMAAGTLLALALNHGGFAVETIGSRFSYVTPAGALIPGIPPYPPVFHLPTFEAGQLLTFPTAAEWPHLIVSALTIALLAALESLLSATVADSLTGTTHDPDAELTGIGIGNVLTALAAGIPATGAIARTTVCINNGAKTPLASSFHAVLIMIYVLLLAPWISFLPMTCLAALLIHTAWRMSHAPHFVRILRAAIHEDSLVLLITFVLTVAIDMVAGVGAGMACAGLLWLKNRWKKV